MRCQVHNTLFLWLGVQQRRRWLVRTITVFLIVRRTHIMHNMHRYVMKRTARDGVAVWFWPRDDFTVPDSVRYGEPIIHPDLFFGLPDAYFPFSQSCLSDHFDAHQIIFDDTFCVRLVLLKYTFKLLRVSLICTPGRLRGCIISYLRLSGDLRRLWVIRLRWFLVSTRSYLKIVVDNNPTEFVNAYWEINSLRIYTPRY
jgi:hypothetical protein